jgi:rhodanese-related sulfurtransferase
MSTVDSSEVEYSDIVGVFRDRAQAEEAMNELKQAGFPEDEMDLKEYELQSGVETLTTNPVLQPSNKRVIVHVKAPGKEQEAVGILAQHGANNADIPVGTKLIHGVLVGTGVQTPDLMPGEANEVPVPDDLFEEEQVPGVPAEPEKQDTHTPRL